jgi:hypothetical protein
VYELTRRSIDESVHFARYLICGIKHGEIAMISHAHNLQRYLAGPIIKLSHSPSAHFTAV